LSWGVAIFYLGDNSLERGRNKEIGVGNLTRKCKLSIEIFPESGFRFRLCGCEWVEYEHWDSSCWRMINFYVACLISGKNSVIGLTTPKQTPFF
jgi:hypothetical protein